MACPLFQFFFKPILELFKNNDIYTNKEIISKLRVSLDVNDEDFNEFVPSGKTTKFNERTRWAITYLFQAGLLNRVERGKYQISESGKQLLSENVPITTKTLENYESFIEFKNRSSRKDESDKSEKTVVDNLEINNEEQISPDEVIEDIYRQINKTLADELLSEILKLQPTAFEKLVLDLLHKMGYGKFKDAYSMTKKSHDDGIDGIILEDKLGFNKIYVQAKRYDRSNKVSVKDIREFIGAIHNKEGKGLFVTSSEFSPSARSKAKEDHIILINGKELANYMIEYDFGVSPKAEYKIKKLDSDFFDDYLELT